MAEQLATQLPKLEGLQGVADPKIDIHGLNSAIKRVNVLLTTAKSVDALEHTMHERHSTLQAVVNDARNALVRAASQVSRAIYALNEEAKGESARMPTVIDEHDWYEYIDIFALAEQDLKMMLETHLPQDADDFDEFVFQTTYAKLEDYRERRCSPNTAFARKALQLVCALLSSKGGAFAGFRHLVWAKKELLRCDCDSAVTVEEVTSLSGPLNQAIEWLLKRENHDGATKFKIDDRLSFNCTSIPQYFDAAESRRALFEGWVGHDCCMDESVGQDGDGEQYGQCWHKRNEHLMLLLNQAAYREVKHNVWTATQHILPPELIEEIFEYALLVEEVPVNADVRELSANRYRPIKQEYRARNCGMWW
ncbi:hypothetical protein LTR15_012587 [Elasticomyces elasticus]|nr:hypothetical protein LTR15_012587 [Elasticomyces elasticus]